MAKKTAIHRLNAARDALTTATAEIAEVDARRNAALMADDDNTAAKLFSEIERLRAAVRGHTDKIALLEAEAKREKAAAIERGHQTLISRFAKMLEGSDADLSEASELISQAWKKICSGIDKREAARAAFSVHSAHARAAAESIDGAAMAAEAVMHLFSYDFYRISARPLQGGVPGARTRPALPGAKPPNLQIALQPEKITPLSEKLKAATAFAVRTLRLEISTATEASIAPAPAEVVTSDRSPGPRDAAEIQREVQAEADAREAMLSRAPMVRGATPPNIGPRERTAAEVELAKLLNRQNELSADISPEGEAAYQAVCLEVTRVSEQVENERMEKAS